MEPRGAKREPGGTKLEPRGSKKEPGGTKSKTFWRFIFCLKSRSIDFGWKWEVLERLKHMKNMCFLYVLLVFSVCRKLWKIMWKWCRPFRREQQVAGSDGQGGTWGGLYLCLFCYIELSVIYSRLYTPWPGGSTDLLFGSLAGIIIYLFIHVDAKTASNPRLRVAKIVPNHDCETPSPL